MVFLKHLHDQDDLATRVYPANVIIIHSLYDILDIDHPNEGQLNRSIINLITATFFWLL